MLEPKILLCGATGALGGAIASRLQARGIPFRALVRPGRSAAAPTGIGIEHVVGDLRDPASLRGAVAGIDTVISTANSVSRVLSGEGDLSIRDVDDRGYTNLIEACEQAGVERFVFASMLGDFGAAHTPFTDAKLATERRLQASRMHEVIVRPDMFQEVWLSPAVGFDWPHGKVTVYGRGESRHAYIGIEDVAEAMVRLTLAEDPPRVVEMGGPEALSPNEAVAAFERALGKPIKTSHVPRVMMRIGRTAMRRVKPVTASLMGMALASDLAPTVVRDEALRELGIGARPVRRYIDQAVATGDIAPVV
jgi:uncharacterized protein YbjT (DUF2867 family)